MQLVGSREEQCPADQDIVRQLRLGGQKQEMDSTLSKNCRDRQPKLSKAVLVDPSTLYVVLH